MSFFPPPLPQFTEGKKVQSCPGPGWKGFRQGWEGSVISTQLFLEIGYVSGDQEPACKDGPGPISIRLGFSSRLIWTPHRSLWMLVISTTALVMARPGPGTGGQTDLALNVVLQGGRQLNLFKTGSLGDSLREHTYERARDTELRTCVALL